MPLKPEHLRDHKPTLVTLLRAIYLIALRVIYYHQRIRHEGFDIEFMMNAARMNAPVSLFASDVSVAASHAEGA